MAAASSLISTVFHFSSPLSRSPNRKLSLPLSNLKCLSLLHRNHNNNNNNNNNNSRILCFLNQFLHSRSLTPHNPLFAQNPSSSSSSSSSAFNSLLLLCTSLALSVSLFVADVDPASAFVVTTPRKLQTDELATVRLFQENTPSVVYITNLAVKYFLFTIVIISFTISVRFKLLISFVFVFSNIGKMLLLWMCWRCLRGQGLGSCGIKKVTLSPIIM